MKAGRPKVKCEICLGRIPSKRVMQRKTTCDASCAAKLRWKNSSATTSVVHEEEEQPMSLWGRVKHALGMEA